MIETGAYDAANKLQTYGNTSYTWDLNGNQTANGVTTTYVWDYENKMVQLHDGVDIEYRCDGANWDGFGCSRHSHQPMLCDSCDACCWKRGYAP